MVQGERWPPGDFGPAGGGGSLRNQQVQAPFESGCSLLEVAQFAVLSCLVFSLGGERWKGGGVREEPQALDKLTLPYNQFTGPLPRSLNKLRNLKQLDMGYNQLTGRIPRRVRVKTDIWSPNSEFPCGFP